MQFLETIQKDVLVNKGAEIKGRPFRQQSIHCHLNDQEIF
jgi:hypothetical protein